MTHMETCGKQKSVNKEKYVLKILSSIHLLYHNITQETDPETMLVETSESFYITETAGDLVLVRVCVCACVCTLLAYVVTVLSSSAAMGGSTSAFTTHK